MPQLYFRNTRTGKRYEIIRIDNDAGTIVLKGGLAEFTEKYNKELFKRLGYVLEKGDN